MGKKAKVGKARKDKFYKLAKETGYRARSSFKLLQLNRKFEFLQKSRVCIDLCAAPGGWLQVAAQHMPVSSVIVGVDLVPIKPIQNCVTLTEDITTEKCRQALRKELQTWKADVVLNDGAPNVGKNWIFDAFAQAELTLYAMKLAVEFLRKGGWFVTKVFRSKDYHALMWVFNQLFKKVHATKPQASRNESAEIFVVCQGFLAPDKLDPKFLDPKHVFKDVQQDTPTQTINLLHPEKIKKKAEGYKDNDYTLRHAITDVQFIQASNHLEVLAMCSEIKLENEAILNHKLTTPELRECCRDTKLLGKTELRSIITWRKKMEPVLEEYLKKQKEEQGASSGSESDKEEEMDCGEREDGEKKDEEKEGESTDEEEKLKEQLADIQDQENKDAKRKQRKVAREKRKLRDKMALNMIIPGDTITQTDDISLFDLKKIKSAKQLKHVEEDDMSGHEDAEIGDATAKLPKHISYSRHDKDMDDWSDDDHVTEEKQSKSSDDSDSDALESDELEMEDDDEADNDVDQQIAQDVPDKESNPLVVKMESTNDKAQRQMEMWFKKDVFSGLEQDKDEDLEIEKMTNAYKLKGGVVLEKEKKKKKTKRKAEDKDSGLEADDDYSDSDLLKADDTTSEHKTKTQKKEKTKKLERDNDSETKSSQSEQEVQDSETKKSDSEPSDAESSSSDSDSEEDDELYQQWAGSDQLTSAKELKRQRKQAILNKSKKDGFEIVAAETEPRRIRKLDPVGLAIGEEMIKSAKRRREIIDDSYNRYTFNDENLPAWFTNEEKRHVKRQMPATKEQVAAYKERLKLINAAPIKKIAEAKARKRKKMNKRLEKARKKAEAISDAVDVSQKEKVKNMKEVYKKAGLLKAKKENVTYVVAKRGGGKRVSRPTGVKGKFRVVDPRMKKDNMRAKTSAKQQRKGRKAKGGGGKKR